MFLHACRVRRVGTPNPICPMIPQGFSLTLDHHPGHIWTANIYIHPVRLVDTIATCISDFFQRLAIRDWPPIWHHCCCCSLGHYVPASGNPHVTQMLGSKDSSHKVSKTWILLSNLWLSGGRNRRKGQRQLTWMFKVSRSLSQWHSYFSTTGASVHPTICSFICLICLSSFVYLLSIFNVPGVVLGTGDTMNKTDLMSAPRKLHSNGRR